MPTDSLPPEVHRVKTKLANGSIMYYFGLRGRKGTGFFKSPHRLPRDHDFHTAYVAALESAKPKRSGYLTRDMVDDYFASTKFRRLAPRSKQDNRKWIGFFEKEFGEDPVEMFTEWESLGEVNTWRKNWAHSPKQYDDAGTHIAILLNWAVKEGKLKKHHCSFEKVYEADRASIIWTQEHMTSF